MIDYVIVVNLLHQQPSKQTGYVMQYASEHTGCTEGGGRLTRCGMSFHAKSKGTAIINMASLKGISVH